MSWMGDSLRLKLRSSRRASTSGSPRSKGSVSKSGPKRNSSRSFTGPKLPRRNDLPPPPKPTPPKLDGRDRFAGPACGTGLRDRHGPRGTGDGSVGSLPGVQRRTLGGGRTTGAKCAEGGPQGPPTVTAWGPPVTPSRHVRAPHPASAERAEQRHTHSWSSVGPFGNLWPEFHRPEQPDG